jgi:hypothetical protein
MVRTLAIGMLSLGLLAACGDDAIVPQNDTFTAQMNAAKENNPANTRNSTGSAIITIDAARTQVTFSFTTANLDSVTAGHIHCCAPTTANAGIVVPLLAFPVPGVAQTTYSGTVSGSVVTSAVLAGPNKLEALVDSILAGHAYVNLHTVGAPGGEIRGQLQ